MAKNTCQKSSGKPGYYAAQFHRTKANKARRAARRARIAKARAQSTFRRSVARGVRWATRYIRNLTRRNGHLDLKRPEHLAEKAANEARIEELRKQFEIAA